MVSIEYWHCYLSFNWSEWARMFNFSKKHALMIIKLTECRWNQLKSYFIRFDELHFSSSDWLKIYTRNMFSLISLYSLKRSCSAICLPLNCWAELEKETIDLTSCHVIKSCAIYLYSCLFSFVKECHYYSLAQLYKLLSSSISL